MQLYILLYLYLLFCAVCLLYLHQDERIKPRNWIPVGWIPVYDESSNVYLIIALIGVMNIIYIIYFLL
jgi:hypothetical protein